MLLLLTDFIFLIFKLKLFNSTNVNAMLRKCFRYKNTQSVLVTFKIKCIKCFVSLGARGLHLCANVHPEDVDHFLNSFFCQKTKFIYLCQKYPTLIFKPRIIISPGQYKSFLVVGIKKITQR